MAEADIFNFKKDNKLAMCEFEQECLILLSLIVDAGKESFEKSRQWRDC